MRIFIASGIFHPDSGGPATYLFRLLPELLARGHEIRVLAYGNAPTHGYPYPVERIPFTRTRMLRYLLAYRRGVQWANLIYLNSLGVPRTPTRKPILMKVVGDYAWERSVNKGWIPPTTDIDQFQTTRYSHPLVDYSKASRSREVQRMDHIIVPSEYLRRMVIGWGADPTKVQVIYNALDSSAITARVSREEARQQLSMNLQPDQKVLFTAARITAWKGIAEILRALPPDVQLIVAGDGPVLAEVRELAKTLGVNAHFPGKQSHDQVALFMRAADYFILYSGYEGLSHTILEALYAGTPVIASKRGGNPEVVQEGVNGLLVPHPDIPALQEAIRRAFEPGTRDRLAAGTGIGLDRFEWSRLVDQTVRTLEGVATR
jgi:glycosyltransferase involved in cell wall biosynthesis